MAMHFAWIVGAVAGSRCWIRCKLFCNASSAAGQSRWRRSRVGYVAHVAEAGTRVWDPPSVHNAGSSCRFVPSWDGVKTTVLCFSGLPLPSGTERRVTRQENATLMPRAMALMVTCRSLENGRLDCLEAAQSCEIFN